MKKKSATLSLIIILLTPILSYADNTEYPYKVLVGATGNRTLIKTNDRWIHIRYSNKSNQEALKMLLGLKWEVLDRNNENKIFIRGQLLESYGIDKHNVRKIFDFILQEWKISCPFEYYVMPEDWVPGDNMQVKTKDLLDESFFINAGTKEFGKYCRFSK